MGVFIFDFSKCSKEFRKKILVVCGGQTKTKDRIFVKNKVKHIKHFFNFEHFPESEDGDGTVPKQSSTAFKDSILTLKVNQRRLETWLNSNLFMFDWHAFFLNNGRVQNVIKRFLDENVKLKKDWYQSIGGGIDKL